MLLVLAGLVCFAVAANVFAQRPRPKDSPPPKKGPIKGISPKGPSKGVSPTGGGPTNFTPSLPAVPTNTPSFGTGPRLVTPPVINGVTGYLGGGYNPALVSPLNPYSPVNNPWNYVTVNPWTIPPLNPWSTPATPWINPWVYGPNYNPLVNLNPMNNPFNPMVNPLNPLNPWNNNPWALNPAVNNFGPQFAFPNANPFAPFGPGANFLR
ncbi:MAG: hypothetical protein FJ271_24840 [Planctomycetes bacterium]|nr:hypothetical protein [Planctomycetota bacterium]